MQWTAACDTNAILEMSAFPPVMRRSEPQSQLGDSVAIYEYAPSMKTQKEEKWAVMGRELLCAVCGL
jgi:hypothetical protein